MMLAKICLLGEVYVGKTSLIRRYVDRAFSENYLSTVGVTISRKLIRLSLRPGEDPAELQLIFWDLEGGQNFREISSTYLSGAHAAVVVGDVTRTETLEALDGFIDQFHSINPNGLVIVALNKSDLQETANRPRPEQWVHRDHVLTTLYTSARTNDGVDQLFENLGAGILQGKDNEPTHL